MHDVSTLLYLTPPFLIGYVLGYLKLRPLLVAGSLFVPLVSVFLGVLTGFIATPQVRHRCRQAAQPGCFRSARGFVRVATRARGCDLPGDFRTS